MNANKEHIRYKLLTSADDPSMSPKCTTVVLWGLVALFAIACATYCITSSNPVNQSLGGGVSLILQGYNIERLEKYSQILEAYISYTDIDQIIIVWNGESKMGVQEILKKYERVEIVFMKNSVHNRFFVGDKVRNEIVLVVDDDVLLTEHGVRCMFDAIKKDMNRLIGMDKRLLNLKDGTYQYSWNVSEKYGLIIGKTMMFHKKYMDAYKRFPKSLLEATDFKGDDILMNALIANITKIGPLVVKSSQTLRENLPEPGGLSSGSNTRGWLPKRHEAANIIQDHFPGKSYFETEDVHKCITQNMF